MITNYVHNRSKIRTRLATIQFEEHTRERIVTLTKDCNTCWHAKLSILKKYVILQLFLKRILPADALPLLDSAEDEIIAEGMLYCVKFDVLLVN